MDTAIWIIIAVVVVIVILALVLLLLRQRKARRRVQAEEIRQNATQQVSTVRHREAVAEEADARARKAQAEADAKAAEAKRLQEQARHHQGHAAESRHEVESEFARADRLDPDVRRNADGRDRAPTGVVRTGGTTRTSQVGTPVSRRTTLSIRVTARTPIPADTRRRRTPADETLSQGDTGHTCSAV
ncbi:hypothetical protein WDY80_20935 [Gordonia hongkongensis]|uniref:hypothetical protein n=1 Tax=Gordonia hongkongensis TaxID=1701090 RepID=UPI0030CC8D21